MNLKALVQTVSDWRNKTAVEIAAVLNTQSVEVRDDQMYTWAGVALAITSTNAENMRIFMEANGLGWAVHQLGGSGIQLSYPATQDMLTNLIAAGVVGADTLKWIGIHYISPYANDGGVGEVTELEVQAVIDQLILEARIINATALANERMANAVDKVATWAQCWEDAV
jgi:hypothetical protein